MVRLANRRKRVQKEGTETVVEAAKNGGNLRFSGNLVASCKRHHHPQNR